MFRPDPYFEGEPPPKPSREEVPTLVWTAAGVLVVVLYIVLFLALIGASPPGF